MKNDRYMRSARPLASLALVSAAMLLLAAASIRAEDSTSGLEHGLSHAVGSSSVCPGGTSELSTLSGYFDSNVEDVLVIKELYYMVGAVRIPAVGTLQPTEVFGNAVALGPPTPDAPDGTLPVVIGAVGNGAGVDVDGDGVDDVTLPGDPAQEGRFRFRADFMTDPGATGDIIFSSFIVYEDLCESGAGDCPIGDVTDIKPSNIDVVIADLTVQKTANITQFCLNEAPVDVTYSYTVTNVGSDVLSPPGIFDDECGVINTDDLVGGDDGDLLLEPGEAWVYECTDTVSTTTTNTVMVTAEAVALEDCVAVGQTTFTVTGTPNPTCDVGPDQTVCPGEPGDFCANASGGTPPYTYMWSNGATTPCISVTIPGTYTVVVTDSLLCASDSCSADLINFVPEEATASGGPVCDDDPVQLLGGPNGMLAYSWTGPMGFTSNQQNPIVDPAVPGEYCLTITDPNNCMDTTCTTVVVNAPVPATPTNSGPVCEGFPVTLTGAPNGMTSYSWTGPSGFLSNQQSPIVNPAVAGQYCLTIVDPNGCTDTACTVVVVDPLPTATADSDPVCEDDPVTLMGGPPGQASYSWTGPNGFTSSQQNPVVNPAVAGEYCLVVTDGNGCQSPPACTTVVVNPNPVATASNDGPVCAGASVTLMGGPGGLSYSWTGPNGFTSIQQNPVVNPAVAGEYCLTVTDANDCMDTMCTTVVIITPPTAVASGGPVCEGDPVQLMGLPDGMMSYAWTGPAGFTSNLQNPIVDPAVAGEYCLTVVDANGCTDTDCTIVVVNPNPVATATNNGPACDGDAVALMGGPNGMDIYSWTGPNGYTSNLQNPLVNPAVAGEYCLVVTDPNGCMDEACTTVVLVPNPTCNVNDAVVCPGEPGELCANASGGTPPYSYMWSNGATTPCISVTIPGNYSVVVTDANGCTSSNISACTGTLSLYSPSCEISGPSLVTEGSRTEYCGPLNQMSYSWSVAGDAMITPPTTTRCVNVVSTGPNPFTLTLNVVDENGCPAVCTKTVTVVPDCLPQDGWLAVDNGIELTANEPTYWSVLTGLPKGVSPFTVLDPGVPGGPGVPADDGSGDRVLRGFVLGWAVNSVGEEISWNHLKGEATIIDYRDQRAWEYNSFNHQVVLPVAHGVETGTPGQLFLDGVEYSPSFEELLMNFQAAGSSGFSGPNGSGITIESDTDLTLHPVGADLRQNNCGPVTTNAQVSIWNENETKFSGTNRCITCWDQTLISDYDAPNHFLRAFLQTEHGKARIRGVPADICNVPDDPATPENELVVSIPSPLLGVHVRQLSITATGMREAAAGGNLFGLGVDPSAVIEYDVSGGPPEGQMPQTPEEVFTWLAHQAGIAEELERRRKASVVAPPEAAMGSPIQDRVSGSEKGSLVIFSKVEIRWREVDDDGWVPYQDTFISLTNDYPGDVNVQLYFVNGDIPPAP